MEVSIGQVGQEVLAFVEQGMQRYHAFRAESLIQ
jgi:hypothetical protein